MVKTGSLGLIDNWSVPFQTEVFQCAKDLGSRAWLTARLIDVLKTHKPATLIVFCIKVAGQSCK
jgi:hypothetical protein